MYADVGDRPEIVKSSTQIRFGYIVAYFSYVNHSALFHLPHSFAFRQFSFSAKARAAARISSANITHTLQTYLASKVFSNHHLKPPKCFSTFFFQPPPNTIGKIKIYVMITDKCVKKTSRYLPRVSISVATGSRPPSRATIPLS